MNITSEHLKIVHCLEEDSYSYRELEEILGVGKNKLRHDINTVGKILNFQTITPEKLHERLTADHRIKELLRSHQSMTPDERRLYLALLFVENNMVNLSEVSRDLDITRRTASNDLCILKKELQPCNLQIESANATGITLTGENDDKEHFFFEVLMKVFIERDYLPLKFEEFFIRFDNFKERYRIEEMLVELIEVSNIVANTFTIMALESRIYLYLAKGEKRSRGISHPSDIENREILESVNRVLDRYAVFSENEKDIIIDYCLKNNRRNIREYYREEMDIVKKMLIYISENTEYKINMSQNNLISFTMRNLILKFKRKLGVREFYPINRSLEKEYEAIHKKLKKIFMEYLGELDSFDEIALFMNVLKNSHLEQKESRSLAGREKGKEKIIVVYKYFSQYLILKVCEELEIALEKKIQDFVSIKLLDAYLRRHEVTTILTFEDIKIKNENRYNLIKYRLPLTEANIANLKKLIH